MNQLTIIGNLTRDPELRTTQAGVSVCTFTVAVNRRQKREGQPEADFFRVTAWRERGETCGKYLAKGRKVAVTGPVSASAYMGGDGKPAASLEMVADQVEFFSSGQAAPAQAPADNGGFQQVDVDGELPF